MRKHDLPSQRAKRVVACPRAARVGPAREARIEVNIANPQIYYIFNPRLVRYMTSESYEYDPSTNPHLHPSSADEVYAIAHHATRMWREAQEMPSLNPLRAERMASTATIARNADTYAAAWQQNTLSNESLGGFVQRQLRRLAPVALHPSYPPLTQYRTLIGELQQERADDLAERAEHIQQGEPSRALRADPDLLHPAYPALPANPNVAAGSQLSFRQDQNTAQSVSDAHFPSPAPTAAPSMASMQRAVRVGAIATIPSGNHAPRAVRLSAQEPAGILLPSASHSHSSVTALEATSPPQFPDDPGYAHAPAPPSIPVESPPPSPSLLDDDPPPAPASPVPARKRLSLALKRKAPHQVSGSSFSNPIVLDSADSTSLLIRSSLSSRLPPSPASAPAFTISHDDLMDFDWGAAWRRSVIARSHAAWRQSRHQQAPGKPPS